MAFHPSSWKGAQQLALKLRRKVLSSLPERTQLFYLSRFQKLSPHYLYIILSKVSETVIFDWLCPIFEHEGLLNDRNYRFSPIRSTDYWEAGISQAWLAAFDNQGETYLDSEAFDRVWYESLPWKLFSSEFHSAPMSWISWFLSKRTMSIQVDKVLSQPPMNFDVFQGLTLASTLFHPFINDHQSPIHSTILPLWRPVSYSTTRYRSGQYCFQCITYFRSRKNVCLGLHQLRSFQTFQDFSFWFPNWILTRLLFVPLR